MYILDTNHCIYLLNATTKRAKKLTHQEESTYIATQNLSDSLYISKVTLAELYFGLHSSQHKEENLHALGIFKNSLTILPLTENILRLFGEIKTSLRRQGKTMSDFDLLIGCTAISHNAILVTNDKAFQMLEPLLKHVNWSN